MAPVILVIEDEPAIADTLVYALRTEGMTPVWRAQGREAEAVMTTEAVALVILDVGLPDGSGFDVCRRLRARWPVPILFLTARDAEIDRVVGLEIGGDDYVTKPFSPREVVARVRAILRRTQGHGATAVPAELPAGATASAGFVVNQERCEVSYRAVRLTLTRYEYRLLALLVAAPGRVYSRDVLMAQVWDDPGASLDRTVDAHVKSLRAKLREVDPTSDPIETRRGLGYCLRVMT